MRDAELLILDEPTSNLAPTEVADLLTILRRLRAEGKGIVFISHKLPEVLESATRSWCCATAACPARAGRRREPRPARRDDGRARRHARRTHPLRVRPARCAWRYSDLAAAGTWLSDVRRARRARFSASPASTATARSSLPRRWPGCAARTAARIVLDGRDITRAPVAARVTAGHGLHAGRPRLDRAGAQDVRRRKSDAARQRPRRPMPAVRCSTRSPAAAKARELMAEYDIRAPGPRGRRRAAFRRQPAEDRGRARTRPRAGGAGGASGRLGSRSRRDALRARPGHRACATPAPRCSIFRRSSRRCWRSATASR